MIKLVLLISLVTGMSYVKHGGSMMLELRICYFYDKSGSEIMKRLTGIINDNKALFYHTQLVKELALVRTQCCSGISL